MGIEYYGLRGWPCTRRRSAPWVWLWDFFGWHNWITLFIATSKHLTSMASAVIWGHLRPFCQKLLFDIFKRSRLHFDWFYGHWLLNGLRGWPCTKRRSAPWVWFWDFFGWHNWITLFIATSKLWPQWPRRSLEVIWGCLVINSCLPFFKVLDYFLFVFMGIIGNPACESEIFLD